MELSGKVALITGAAKRIGAEIARSLAAGGARVAVHYHTSRAEAEALVEELTARGGAATTVSGDVARAADVRDLVGRTVDALGGLDILINNAAVFDRTTFEEIDEAAWDRQLDVNLKGTFLCALEAGRQMQADRRPGKIVNVTDVCAWSPWTDYIAYSVSKAGVLSLTKALAKALAPEIQVNAIAPGPILPAADEPAEAFARIAARLPLRRAGTPAEVASAVRFFLDNDFVTGQVLAVDGGRSLL